MEEVNFDKIKKEFIVDQEEYSKGQLFKLMSNLLGFCKVTKDGQVIVLKNVSTRKMLKLILSARFIAHAADKSVSDLLTKQELKAYSGIGKDEVFNTRFAEIVRDNFAERKGEGVKAKNILLVEQFLENLKNEN